jgi:hypothetical protein
LKFLVEIFNRKQSWFSSYYIILGVKMRSLALEALTDFKGEDFQHSSHRAIQQHGTFDFADP